MYFNNDNIAYVLPLNTQLKTHVLMLVIIKLSLRHVHLCTEFNVLQIILLQY